MNYTSKELSQKIKEAGFVGESEMYWCWYNVQSNGMGSQNWVLKRKGEVREIKDTYLLALDLIYDICIKHRVAFWGEENNVGDSHRIRKHTRNILELLQQGKQEEVEQYFLDNSILFNK